MEYEIIETRFGLFTSVTPDGTKLTTGLTREGVDDVTMNIRIPVLQGTFDGYESTKYTGQVDGKL